MVSKQKSNILLSLVVQIYINHKSISTRLNYLRLQPNTVQDSQMKLSKAAQQWGWPQSVLDLYQYYTFFGCFTHNSQVLGVPYAFQGQSNTPTSFKRQLYCICKCKVYIYIYIIFFNYCSFCDIVTYYVCITKKILHFGNSHD